jgi:hypothetical protein
MTIEQIISAQKQIELLYKLVDDDKNKLPTEIKQAIGVLGKFIIDVAFENKEK